MVALAARGAQSSPIPTRASAPSGSASLSPQEGWWRYVERGRHHEVIARWRVAEGEIVVRESSPLVPGLAVEQAQRITQPWEARLALWLLESRLSQLGEYWRERSIARGWLRIGRPVNAPVIDLRANQIVDASLIPVAHHYFDEHGGGDTLIAALKAAQPERFVVIRAEMDVPSLDLGRIDVVHPMLPGPLVRSVVAREQIGLAQAGLPKLVTREDYHRAFGAGGDKRAARLVGAVVDRMRDGQLERPRTVAAVEDVYQEFLGWLSDPRLLALHHRFLVGTEEDEVLAGGPPMIRKLIAAKRAGADHHEQHLLTILEASLLARERLQSGKLDRRDPEVRALTRLAYYL